MELRFDAQVIQISMLSILVTRGEESFTSAEINDKPGVEQPS